MIRTALNAMIYVMLAKFIINDLPHAAGLLANPNYGEPATPRQLHYIAVLCQQLKITTPYEEQVKTSGEAGRLIRELEAERKHRGKPTGSEKLGQFVRGVVADFHANKDRYQQEFQGLVPEVEISDIRLHGSYAPGGTPTKESDIDVLIEYSGDLSEELVAERLAGRVFGYGGAFDVSVKGKRLGSGNPFVPIGVWFESPEVEAEIKSAPGLLEHIGSSMTELGRRYDTAPKSIGFAEMEHLATHTWSDVTFNAVFADLWLMDEVKTRQILKHLIPHEFGHYMMKVEHVKIPLPRGPKWREARKEWGENYADEFAGRESGMTKEQVGILAEELRVEWEHRKAEGENPTVRVDTNEEVSQNRVSGVAIAWVGSKDIGSLHYNLEINGTGEILFMQVDEEYRGLGVGKKMYQAVENLAKRYGVKKLTSEVGIPGYGDIERAENFWKTVGFTVTNGNAEKRLGGGNPELSEVVITEIEENITARIPGIRAVAELTRLSQPEAASFGLEANNWLWFNRLINQSGIPRVGSLLLDKVLEYCKGKNYSIINQVNAYGAISQKELENWYVRKGFTPVDRKKYGNALLKWRPGN